MGSHKDVAPCSNTSQQKNEKNFIQIKTVNTMSATNQNGNVMPATTQNGNRFCCQSSGSLNILFVCGLTFFSHSDSLTSAPLST